LLPFAAAKDGNDPAMNRTSLTGVALLIAVIALASASSGLSPLVLWNLPGFLIVVGGTLAATLISFDVREVGSAVRSLWVVFHRGGRQGVKDAQDIQNAMRAWLHGDVGRLQSVLATTGSPFLRLGLELITDNVMPLGAIVETLKRRIEQLRAKERGEAQLFRSMAGFAPAFGVMATLFGLVQMFGNMTGDNLQGIMAGLSLALLTTIYGVILSFGFFRPFAVKLEHRTENRVRRMQVILEALCLMSQTHSPGVVREFAESVDRRFADELQAAQSSGRAVK
jgi:chemotaxis protein MotA